MPGTRRSGIEDPPRPAVVDPQRPALAGRKIDEWKIRSRRTDQSGGAADRSDKFEHGVIAAEHQMIAVVDRQPDGAVEIGAASPARVSRRLVHDDSRAGDRASRIAAASPARPAPIM